FRRRERLVAEHVPLKHAARALERAFMVTEAVVQDRGRVVRENGDAALAVGGRVVGGGREQRGRFRFVTTEGVQNQPGVADRRNTGDVGKVLVLVHERGGAL